MTGPGSAVMGGRAGRGGAGRGGDWRRGWLHSYSGHNGHNVVLIMLDATNGITFFILLYTLLFYFILLNFYDFMISLSLSRQKLFDNRYLVANK